MPSLRQILSISKKKELKKTAQGPEFKSTNNLPFEVRVFEETSVFYPDYVGYKVGTCYGLYSCSVKHYEILTVVNSQPGNGHFQDVLDWFENSCRRDKRDLVIQEVWNQGFKRHLIEKRGFKPFGKEHVLKKIV